MAKLVLCHVAKLSKIKQMWHLQMICSKFAIEVNPFFRPVFVCLIFQYGWLRQKSNTYILLTEIFVSIIGYVLMELSSILAGPKEHNLVNILSIKH